MKIIKNKTKKVPEVIGYKCDGCGKQVRYYIFSVKERHYTDYNDDGKRPRAHICSPECLYKYLGNWSRETAAYIDVRFNSDRSRLISKMMHKGIDALQKSDYPDYWDYAKQQKIEEHGQEKKTSEA